MFCCYIPFIKELPRIVHEKSKKEEQKEEGREGVRKEEIRNKESERRKGVAWTEIPPATILSVVCFS